jgi:hydrogenase/urease accessory protein HupE
MRAIRCILFAAIFTMIAEPASAHPPPLGISGFFGGLLHPMYVTAHVTAVLGLGLLIGQQVDWGRAALGAAIMALWVGLGVLTLGVVARGADLGVMALSVASGVMVALARPLPQWAGGVLAAMTGLAVGLDSPPDVVSLSEANLMLLGTGLGGTILFFLAVECGRQFRRGWHLVAARIFGSWMAASAILALTLQLAG